MPELTQQVYRFADSVGVMAIVMFALGSLCAVAALLELVFPRAMRRLMGDVRR